MKKKADTINWQYYPKSAAPTSLAHEVVEVFKNAPGIDSASQNDWSDVILAAVAPGLRKIGFKVEAGKRDADKIIVPVLFGRNGKIEKPFHADAHHREKGFVVEVEAGRAIDNNNIYKDLFEACMMHNVEYLAIAVRNIYGKRAARNFEKVCTIFDTLYASNRLKLPLLGVLVIGY